jgi:quinol monooxygenase YgiN
MTEVQVIVHCRVSVGHVDEVLALVSELRKASLAEPGCRRFDVFRKVDDDRRIVLLERYVSHEAFEVHRTSDHTINLLKGLVPRLDSQVVEAYDVPEG